MKKYLSILVFFGGLIILATPFIVFANGGTMFAPPAAVNDTDMVANTIKSIFNPLWQLAAGLAVIMFIIAGILFITSNGEPGKISTARSAMVWGAVGIMVAAVACSLVILVSGWVK